MHLWMCLLVVSSLCAKTKAQSRVVCYFDSWSLTRTGDEQYRIEDIDPSLCTHVIYAFADLASDGTIRVGDPSTDLPSGLDGYNRLNLLKQQNPNLKTLISIGGEDAGSAIFSRVFNSEELRAMFVDNAVIFVEENGFDGLDIDWEFPGEGTGSSTSDKVAFTDTLADIRTRFTPLGLLLTVACSSPSYFLSGSYDVPSIAENVDFINLMTYDFHSSSELATGLNAPLYEREGDDIKELNVNAGVENWLENGAPAEKIVLGMSFFGNAFTLRHPSDNGVGAPALGPAPGTEGILRYSQICKSQLEDDDWNIDWDNEAEVPFASRGSLWVTYDDPESIAEKAQYVLDMELGGAMVWSIDMDDFRGNCGDKNILLQKINGYLG